MHSIFNKQTKEQVKAELRSITENGTESIHKITSVHFDDISENEISLGILTASGQQLIFNFTKDGKKG